jgi:RIO kinase 2
LSSAQIAARTIRELEPEDWAVLHALERSISGHESVSLNVIETESKLHRDQVEFRLGRLNYIGFVLRNRFGFVLNTAGLDAIALNSLVQRNLISGMGKSIGMGKESDVYEVKDDSGNQLVIKFYRIGRTSFRSTRRSRSYMNPENQHQWLTINIAAAHREALGLKKASEAGIDVPKLIATDRHAVLMTEIHGIMLYKCTQEDILKPKQLLRVILEDIKKAYGADMINGDISEFNILFDGLKPWIIDWPQFVPASHANAEEMLRRDLQNVSAFFERKFAIRYNLQDGLDYVRALKKRIRTS